MTRPFELVPDTLKGRGVAHAIALAGEALSHRGFRGYWRAARLLGRLAPPGQDCIVQLGEGSRFRFALSDPYWSRLLHPDFVYERELAAVLTRLRGKAFAFLDCGANLGYWSVVAADPVVGCRDIVAVEASPRTYRLMMANVDANPGAFRPIQRAVFSRTGETVDFEVRIERHGGASIQQGGANTQPVETITIDDLASMLPDTLPLVLKLDVEGVEIAALEGATETLRRPLLLAYEDHGRDMACEPSAWLFANTDLAVWYLDDRGAATRMASVEEIRSVKKLPAKGYNFFAATPGSMFEAQLFGA